MADNSIPKKKAAEWLTFIRDLAAQLARLES